jgi:hypothetical protein
VQTVNPRLTISYEILTAKHSVFPDMTAQTGCLAAKLPAIAMKASGYIM